MSFVGYAFLSAVLFALFSGCSGVKTTMYRPIFAPTQDLEVINAGFPERSFIEIAKMGTSSKGDALDRLKLWGKALGADAIVLLDRKEEILRYYPKLYEMKYWGPRYMPRPFHPHNPNIAAPFEFYPYGAVGYGFEVETHVVAVALKYR